MDEKSWWDFWNTSYRSEDGRDYTSSELFRHAADVIHNMAQHENFRILEIACGSGTLSRNLSYSTYHGIDISPAAIEIARSKANSISRPPGAGLPTYEAADFHDWPLSSEPYDLVICVDAIVCFRDQSLVLNKIARSLRPGGTLLLTAINPFVYNRIRRNSANPIQDGPVSRWLTRAELHKLIGIAGLAIERSCTIMPRGNRGVLRAVNSPRLNRLLGRRNEPRIRRLKELAGLGQYRLIVARKGTT